VPVVINDLEIVAPPAPAAAAPAAPAPRTAAGPTPRDLAEALRHLDERAARVRAD
jgi:hypothetical protein